MAHTHEPGVVRETREIRDTDSGTGMGMVVGVLLALILAAIMLWFLFGSGVMNPTTNDGATDITNPTINVDPPNINVNPPANAPAPAP